LFANYWRVRYFVHRDLLPKRSVASHDADGAFGGGQEAGEAAAAL